MKTLELFEAKVVQPDWVKSQDTALKSLFKKFGFRCDKRPTINNKEWWTIGGELKDADKDGMLSREKRVTGLQKAVAKFMFDLHQQGWDVVTFSSYRPNRWQFQVHPNYIYAGDSLGHIETLVKDKLFINTGAEIDLIFQIGLKPPKEEVKPVEKPRILRVVKKAA